jgi:hypothetical protein
MVDGAHLARCLSGALDAALDVQAQRCALAAAFARLISARPGYYNSRRNRTTVRWDRFEGNIQSVLKYCKRQKADTLITNGNQVEVFF